MKLFVDTGNVKEIEALAAIGILDGVTTNPSLLAKESGDYRQILKQICQIVKGPVSAEVVATDTAGMLREGRELAKIDEHIVVKVPFTKDGVKACKALTQEGKRVNVTLIFSATQAWLAARGGGGYVRSVGRALGDAGVAGGEGGSGLRQSVRRAARRHRQQRDDGGARDRRHLRQLRVRDRSA